MINILFDLAENYILDLESPLLDLEHVFLDHKSKTPNVFKDIRFAFLLSVSF